MVGAKAWYVSAQQCGTLAHIEILCLVVLTQCLLLLGKCRQVTSWPLYWEHRPRNPYLQQVIFSSVRRRLRYVETQDESHDMNRQKRLTDQMSHVPTASCQTFRGWNDGIRVACNHDGRFCHYCRQCIWYLHQYRYVQPPELPDKHGIDFVSVQTFPRHCRY